MNSNFIRKFGVIAYKPAHDLQMALVDKVHKQAQGDVCLLLQHEPVFTLGRHASEEHVMVSQQILAKNSIDLVRTERGGEVTYHAPGQIVGYPILNLRRLQLSVVNYVAALEQVMLDVAAEFGITATRDRRNHGIWCGKQKLGSVGIAVRHGISYHGFALNVCPDMTPFCWINPCGLSGVPMTSMVELLGRRITVKEVETILAGHLNSMFSTRENRCAAC
jgi:lipoate-protein ligase B